MPLEDSIKAHARALGFDLVGIAPAADADDFAHLRDWLEQGGAGEMDYMSKHSEARKPPASILPAVRSVVMVGMNYPPGDQPPADGLYGRVARYAAGNDYHDV